MTGRRNVRNMNNNRTRYSYGSYNFGSTARAYSYYPERKTVKKEQPKVIKVGEYSLVHRVALVGIMLFMAALAIGFLCVYGYNYELSSDIASLREELNELKEDNYYLESDFDNNLNLDYIEEVAINRLGMQKPLSYQIKYINVPKQSYTILYNTAEEKKGFWENIKELNFKGAFDSLFAF